MSKHYLKPIVIMPYEYTVYVAYGDEELKEIMEAREFEHEHNMAAVDGLAFELSDTNGTAFSLIYVAKGCPEGVVWHECLHVIHAMMHTISIPMSYENSEVEAYHQGALVEEVLLRIQDRKPKPKKKPKAKPKKAPKKEAISEDKG